MEKVKEKEAEKELWYRGYFLMDSGFKVEFDICEEDNGEEFSVSLSGNGEWPFEKGRVLWLGSKNDLHILTDRVIGWYIEEYKV